MAATVKLSWCAIASSYAVIYPEPDALFVGAGPSSAAETGAQPSGAVLRAGAPVAASTSSAAPFLELVITVGVDPTPGNPSDSCPLTQSLTVEPGTPLVYCFTIRNVGMETYDRQDLTDSLFGSLLVNFPFTLVPGASAFLTQERTLTHTTTSTATWTARDTMPPPPVPVPRSDSDSVTVTVNRKILTLGTTVGVDPTPGNPSDSCPTTDNITVDPGTPVVSCFTIRNDSTSVTFLPPWSDRQPAGQVAQRGAQGHVPSGDVICRGGNDVLRGMGGRDLIIAGDGADLFFGEGGRDHLLGGNGRDVLVGGAANDRLIGGPGGPACDTLRGKDGEDTIYARDGSRDLGDGGLRSDRARVDSSDRVRQVERLF